MLTESQKAVLRQFGKPEYELNIEFTYLSIISSRLYSGIIANFIVYAMALRYVL